MQRGTGRIPGGGGVHEEGAGRGGSGPEEVRLVLQRNLPQSAQGTDDPLATEEGGKIPEGFENGSDNSQGPDAHTLPPMPLARLSQTGPGSTLRGGATKIADYGSHSKS